MPKRRAGQRASRMRKRDEGLDVCEKTKHGVRLMLRGEHFIRLIQEWQPRLPDK